MVLGAFQIVLLFLYGRSIIAVDMFLNVVTTNPTEVGELLGNLLSAILTVCLMYLPPIVCAVVGCVRHWRAGRRALSVVRRASLSALLVALVAIAGSLPGSRPVRPLIDIYPLNVLYNIVLAVDRTERLENYGSTSSSFSAHAVDLFPADSARRIVVIVVGETARGDRWPRWLQVVLSAFRRHIQNPTPLIRVSRCCCRISQPIHSEIPYTR